MLPEITSTSYWVRNNHSGRIPGSDWEQDISPLKRSRFCSQSNDRFIIAWKKFRTDYKRLCGIFVFISIALPNIQLIIHSEILSKASCRMIDAKESKSESALSEEIFYSLKVCVLHTKHHCDSSITISFIERWTSSINELDNGCMCEVPCTPNTRYYPFLFLIQAALKCCPWFLFAFTEWKIFNIDRCWMFQRLRNKNCT